MSAAVPARPLEVRGLRARRGAREVLRGVDLVVDAGERVVVLGANGSGKTTLLRAIAGLDAVESGEIRADGVGLVLQQGALFPHLSVFENVALAVRLKGRQHDSPARAALAALSARGIAIVVVTHDLPFAARAATRALRLRDGLLAAE
ncbi:MAG: ATP-binding cassette domain-containing protein [Phycisphaerales bacterium]